MVLVLCIGRIKMLAGVWGSLGCEEDKELSGGGGDIKIDTSTILNYL